MVFFLVWGGRGRWACGRCVGRAGVWALRACGRAGGRSFLGVRVWLALGRAWLALGWAVVFVSVCVCACVCVCVGRTDAWPRDVLV